MTNLLPCRLFRRIARKLFGIESEHKPTRLSMGTKIILAREPEL